jgi:hypothetical protein
MGRKFRAIRPHAWPQGKSLSAFEKNGLSTARSALYYDYQCIKEKSMGDKCGREALLRKPARKHFLAGRVTLAARRFLYMPAHCLFS